MMLEAVAGRLGLKVGKGVALALALAALLATAGLAFWRGMARIDGLVETARASAIAERDAHWRAEIEHSNTLVEAERHRQAEAATVADQATRAEIDSLQKQLLELEARNAALPGGDRCGIDRDRIRLLNR